jgi:predicted phosphoribosyltransferase
LNLKRIAFISAFLLVGTIAAFAALRIVGSRVQLIFKDRTSAANILAAILRDTLKDKIAGRIGGGDIIVLGIARGGVIIGDILARKLSSDFDVVVVRKLGHPDNKEVAIGAMMEDGTTYLNDNFIKRSQVSEYYIEKERSDQRDEIKRRNATYRRNGMDYKIKGRIVVLVDDGAASGATVIAAARWVKKQDPRHLLIALPVAPRKTVDLLRREADSVEVISRPASNITPMGVFTPVGAFYHNFDPVADEEVVNIMQIRNLLS